MSTLHERLLTRCDPQWWGLGEERPRWLNALRAVVELHAPFQRSTQSLGCRDCSTPLRTQPGRYVTAEPWPCSTITTIARELGVEIGETS